MKDIDHLVKAIVDSGGRILAGSDSPEWFHVYGWALHRELASYVNAGLTDTARVFEWIGKGPRSTDVHHAGPTDPVLLPFRSDPRFARAMVGACATIQPAWIMASAQAERPSRAMFRTLILEHAISGVRTRLLSAIVYTGKVSLLEILSSSWTSEMSNIRSPSYLH